MKQEEEKYVNSVICAYEEWENYRNKYEGRVFFKWDKMDKILKEKGKTKNDIHFHINKNNEIEVFLNDEPLEVESIRVYGDSNIKFQI